jgi:hypothetical protein
LSSSKGKRRERKQKKKGKEKKWEMFSNLEISWKKNKIKFMKFV